MLRPWLTWVLLTLPLLSWAQSSDSTTWLQEVEIRQSLLQEYTTSTQVMRPDSAVLAWSATGTLTDLLRKQGFGHLRMYGPGGLAGASFRGTGSNHTNLMWNGINIVSPLAGQTDFSQIPISFFDDASIQLGGSTSLNGSGAVGATIHLNNRAAFRQGLRLSSTQSVGSFGNRYHDGQLQWSGARYIASVKAFQTQTENHFKFLNENIYPAQTQRRQHNAVRQWGILQQQYWQLTARQMLSLKLWYQDNHYEVPNTTFVLNDGVATERNTFYRALLGWQGDWRVWDMSAQSAWIRHVLDYRDPSSPSDKISTSAFDSFINNAEATRRWLSGQLTMGVNYTAELAHVDAFGSSRPSRHRAAAVTAVKWQHQRWHTSLSVREEWVDNKAQPLAATADLRADINSQWWAYAQVSRSYRLPTFNDLFWQGAGARGNSNLKTELSWGQSLGVWWQQRGRQIKAGLFNSFVDNWILWAPDAAQVWMPENVKKVWSRGIETSAQVPVLVQPSFRLSWSAQYTFTLATTEAAYDNVSSAEVGKQLLYTPRHEGSTTAEVKVHLLQARLVYQYTGKQFTTGDNVDFYALRHYAITNCWASYPLPLRRAGLTLWGEVNNLFHVRYQARAGYPMPGRSFKLGLTFNFNQSYTP